MQSRQQHFTPQKTLTLTQLVEECVNPFLLREVYEHLFFAALKDIIAPNSTVVQKKVAVYHPNLEVLKDLFGGISCMIPAYTLDPVADHIYLSHYKTGKELTFAKELEFEDIFYNRINDIKTVNLSYAINPLYNNLIVPYYNEYNRRVEKKIKYSNVFILDHLKAEHESADYCLRCTDFNNSNDLYYVKYPYRNQIVKSSERETSNSIKALCGLDNLVAYTIDYSDSLLQQHKEHEKFMNIAVSNLHQINALKTQTQPIYGYHRTPVPIGGSECIAATTTSQQQPMDIPDSSGSSQTNIKRELQNHTKSAACKQNNIPPYEFNTLARHLATASSNLFSNLDNQAPFAGTNQAPFADNSQQQQNTFSQPPQFGQQTAPRFRPLTASLFGPPPKQQQDMFGLPQTTTTQTVKSEFQMTQRQPQQQTTTTIKSEFQLPQQQAVTIKSEFQHSPPTFQLPPQSNIFSSTTTTTTTRAPMFSDNSLTLPYLNFKDASPFAEPSPIQHKPQQQQQQTIQQTIKTELNDSDVEIPATYPNNLNITISDSDSN